ncbi:hypothetical protein [Streptomyces sp. NPDC006997]|uniref:hypothetical protein n=1 Tax=Streptomyces sp. NPDC006997 TaxID=3155356 RepID=UPI0033EEC3B7
MTEATEDGPVDPTATESLLPEFLDAMAALEADLAQRWLRCESGCLTGKPE